LAGLQPALARVCRHDDVRVVAVGAGNLALDGVRLEVRGWSEAAEVEEIQSFDVGIMPLTDGPWERGKCGFKIIQYQACGVPVVASPVGANRDIIVDGVNGLLASDTEEWVRALDLLRSDGELRRRLGSAGRESVCAKYSTAVVARDLIKLFKSFEP
jgi:glycosyltransferase involved in cell wall biosynthesis